jgi:addiction module RelE/StbE family toxin
LARELIILPRFKRDYRTARKHPDFDVETLEYVFDVLISGENLPSALREHRLRKGRTNWTGLTVCHLGPDLLLIYRVRRRAVVMHRVGTHRQLFAAAGRRGRRPIGNPRRAR